MDRSIGLLLTILVFLTGSALTAPAPTTQASCSSVNLELAPCLAFIKGNSDQPSVSCCSGSKAIADEAKTQGDRQTICQCLKNVLAVSGAYDKNRIPEIPKRCGVPVSLPPIDSSTDCSKAAAEYVF